jgi:hypothetical protein
MAPPALLLAIHLGLGGREELPTWKLRAAILAVVAAEAAVAVFAAERAPAAAWVWLLTAGVIAVAAAALPARECRRAAVLPRGFAELAGKIEIYRAGQLLAEIGRKLEGDTIVLAADGDCSGAFSAYSVSLPAAAVAAGSALAAAFPSPEQVELWRPKAEVHLVKDNQGAARFLMLEGDPGRGSPLQPPARQGSGAAVLLVNGKPARFATVTRDVANANSYLLELADPDPRSIHFEWTPTNAAGLAGKPVVFAYAAPSPEKKPEEVPVYVRDISLGPSGANYQLALVLEAGAKRVDAARTALGNHRKGWKDISCSSPGGPKLTCTALIDSTSDLHFEVYCEHDEDRPCLSMGMAR